MLASCFSHISNIVHQILIFPFLLSSMFFIGISFSDRGLIWEWGSCFGEVTYWSNYIGTLLYWCCDSWLRTWPISQHLALGVLVHVLNCNILSSPVLGLISCLTLLNRKCCTCTPTSNKNSLHTSFIICFEILSKPKFRSILLPVINVHKWSYVLWIKLANVNFPSCMVYMWCIIVLRTHVSLTYY